MTLVWKTGQNVFNNFQICMNKVIKQCTLYYIELIYLQNVIFLNGQLKG